MPELRKDYLTEDLVLIAPERGDRPSYFKKTNTLQEEDKKNCPFCNENSYMTPETIYTSKDGRVRVIPNKYPAVSDFSTGGYGFHEVLIDTPVHNEKLGDFSAENIYTVLDSLKQRIKFLSSSENIAYVQVFKNDGYQSGASIVHSHWQIIALNTIPNKQLRISLNSEKYFNETGECYLCSLQKKQGQLTIFENESTSAYSPFASLYSYQVNIVPKKHVSQFTDINEIVLFDMAHMIKKVLLSLNNIKRDISFNICFQNPPVGTVDKSRHFYVEIIPRFATFAGFELSTGCFINSVAPEMAAKKIREALYEN